MKQKFLFINTLLCITFSSLLAQTPNAVIKLLNEPYMKGASFSLLVKDLKTNKVVYHYDEGRLLTPASVLKTITTATALDILGENYRYPTTIEYDGSITNGILNGNLYIKGSGDPTLGSSYFPGDNKAFLKSWCEAVHKAGIKEIKGAVISDEQIFDTEGVSPKWMREDMGNYYGAGSYGINVFDNRYKIYFKTGGIGQKASIIRTEPTISTDNIRFHNYLKVTAASHDSTYISGMPFIADRFLYGYLPANKSSISVKGDIPDPALYLASIFNDELKKTGIKIDKKPSSYRLEYENLRWEQKSRENIITTYSPTLKEIVNVCNHVSHNLYADALIKTIGIRYYKEKNQVINSFERGIEATKAHWKKNGINSEDYQVYDGSGLAPTDKISARFVNDILFYMATKSKAGNAFKLSLPKAGEEGSVINFLRTTKLKGNARMKSGGIRGVRTFAGYIKQADHEYVVTIFSNNYNCPMWKMTKGLENILIDLF